MIMTLIQLNNWILLQSGTREDTSIPLISKIFTSNVPPRYTPYNSMEAKSFRIVIFRSSKNAQQDKSR